MAASASPEDNPAMLPPALTPQTVGWEYVESLRRICQSISSGEDLTSVLQAIVDALCDHTPWQLCFIYMMDIHGGFGEIAARRDRIEYTSQSPRSRWDFEGNPAHEALRRNQVIAVPWVPDAQEYPMLVDSAAGKGIVSAAYVPLSSNDPAGRPMLLCVQSTKRMLDDASQLTFLRAVASLASLAATNARLLSEARAAAASAAETSAMLTSVILGVSKGTASSELFREIERRTNHSLVVLDHVGCPTFIGRPPAGVRLSGEAEWASVVMAEQHAINKAVDTVLDDDGSGPASVAISFSGQSEIGFIALRYGERDARATVLSSPTSGFAADMQVAATSAAIVLLRDRLAFEAQADLQHDVVVKLLEGSYSDGYEFAARAAFAGIRIETPTVLLVATKCGRLNPERVDNLVRSYGRRWASSTLEYVDGHFALLLPLDGPRERQVDTFVKGLDTFVRDAEGGSGLVLTRSRSCERPGDYSVAWRECRQAVHLANQVGRSGVVSLEEFGAYRFLLPALGNKQVSDFVRASLGPILDRDDEHAGTLFETIEAFTTYGGRFQETSRRLNIHVSTLRYRIQRIEALLGSDLSDNETRFDLSLAARLERLRRGSI